jgi:non-ribosomal peptide synthetase component F
MLPIGGKLYAGIKELIQHVEVSPFMFFLSAYYLLLSKVSGCMDIVIGTESTGRTKENLQPVVGTFVNVLPLRMQIRAGISFREFLQEVKEQVLEAYENQDYQYNEISAALHEQEGSNGSLVDAHFSFINTVHSTVELEELQFTSYDGLWTETTDSPLSVQVAEEKDGFCIYFIYSRNLFTGDTIELLMDYFRSIVSGIVKDSQSTIDAIEIKDVAV